MIFSLLTGAAMAMINIPAQTVVQEESDDSVRGRVFAVQFTPVQRTGNPAAPVCGQSGRSVWHSARHYRRCPAHFFARHSLF